MLACNPPPKQEVKQTDCEFGSDSGLQGTSRETRFVLSAQAGLGHTL